MKYYTYLHTRNDTGKVFYIGKGTAQRAYAIDRNEHWRSIVSKHGFTAEILAEWPTEEEAYEHEKLLIASFIDMGYILANKTPGGEGIPKGYKWGEEWRRKNRLSKIGRKHTEETKKKMSASSGWRGHTYVTSGFTGFNHTEESRAKMSAARKGTKQSPEHIAKRTAARLKNNPISPNIGRKFEPIAKCEHCLGIFPQASYNRWHGDNCKMKDSNEFVICNECGAKVGSKARDMRWHTRRHK